MNFELKGELKVELKLEVQPNEKCSSIVLKFKDLRTCWDNTCKCMGFSFLFSSKQYLAHKGPFES
jgi:hypothetical protein